jgi:hypothetical protein
MQDSGLTAGVRPREAAVTIVQLINSRNQNVSLLALGVCIVVWNSQCLSDWAKVARYLCEELRIPVSSSDQHQRIPQRACAPVSGTAASPCHQSAVYNSGVYRGMAANDMSDITVQGGSGFHQRYAPAAVVQRLHVPRSAKRGCRCSQSK